MLNKGICPSLKDPGVRVHVRVCTWPLKACCVCSPFISYTIDQLIKKWMTIYHRSRSSRLIKVTATAKNRRTQGKSATAHMNKCNKRNKNKPSIGIHCFLKQIYTSVLTLVFVCFCLFISEEELKVSWGGTCAASLRTVPAWTMNRADYADLIFWQEKKQPLLMPRGCRLHSDADEGVTDVLSHGSDTCCTLHTRLCWISRMAQGQTQ